ncbi:right-handed parallel beta-helix repeat-containing protein [Rhodococcus phenolicus]|uniref:right-handed parallel beta-helix repeat-containing protein n=1 Tax=Rhodococcus phenolicus TaxID=263849 RepID=UPI0012E7C4D9|nr:right-handed parallel beta-helix repeat-containing protein [Rhodococcus phenolicus]
MSRRQAISGTALTAAVAAIATVPTCARKAEEDAVESVPPARVNAQPVAPDDIAALGIAGDGETDDTDAINAALVEQDSLLLPSGRYRVEGTIVVPPGRRLAGRWSFAYTGVPQEGTRLIATGDGRTDPVVRLGEGACLTSLAVRGTEHDPAHDGVVLDGRNLLREVNILHCRTGIDCGYSGVNRIECCNIHDNSGYGIARCVDSIVSLNYVNVNGAGGIHLPAGANDNIITQNKLEWNHGYGINAEDAKHNVLSGNNIDRNGRSGIRLSGCERTVVTANVLRRNGARSEGVADDDTHILSAGGAGTLVLGNLTNSGPNDDGEGYDSPSACIVADPESTGIVVGNDLTGHTGSGGAGAHAVGSGVQLAANLGKSTRAGFVGDGGTASRKVTLAAGEEASETFSYLPLDPFDIGRVHSISLLARNPQDGTRGAASAVVLVARENGDAAVTTEGVSNTVGSTFGDGPGMVGVAFRVDAGGGELTVVLTNTRSDEMQLHVGVGS